MTLARRMSSLVTTALTLAGTTLAVLLCCPVFRAEAHPHHQRTEATNPEEANSEDERLVHTPRGFDRPGKSISAKPDSSGQLQVTVVDASSGKPTYCRVAVVGSDGNYYEPSENPLAEWSLSRTGNRQGKGPIRYYGWFFYCDGSFTVDVPPGDTRIEIAKGYEYRPVVVRRTVRAGDTQTVRVSFKRTAAMQEHGYYSGDTHVHLNRRNPEDDARALDLLAAEDVRFGFLLAMNDPQSYTGAMPRQIWPQDNGFGPGSIQRRGPYAICSGQEYRCGTYGHICLLLHRRLVLEGQAVDPNRWPLFAAVAEETHRLGGYAIHAHGGYSKEIYADFAQRATDGVELLQFAEYRGVSLQGWYHMLNIGYRFPAVGASDYPYCRALADCRTYVHIADEPDFSTWSEGAARGKSFLTTGPLLLLDVEGRRPGETIREDDPPNDQSRDRGHGDASPQRLNVRVRVRCEVTPVTHVELIVNGRRAALRRIPPNRQQGAWYELRETLSLPESAWIAARAFSTAPSGSPDAEAHTNPVYVYRGGAAPFDSSSADWLIERIDERIEANRARAPFPHQEDVLQYFQTSRDRLEALKSTGGMSAEAAIARPAREADKKARATDESDAPR
jgi:hypothetical protein